MRRIEGQRHEARPRFDDAKAELLGDPVGEPGRTHLRNRLAAAGYDERLGIDRPLIRHDAEARPVAFDAFDRCLQPQLGVHITHFREQHPDDVLGRVVAEELAEGLFVPGDAVLFDQGQEIARRITRQCRLAEMRVGRKEILRPRMDIGEVAATTAGDADLLAGCLGMVEHSRAAAALARFDGAHHARSTGADDDHILLLSHETPQLFCLSFPVAKKKVNDQAHLANCQSVVMMRHPKPKPVIYALQEKCCPTNNENQQNFENTPRLALPPRCEDLEGSHGLAQDPRHRRRRMHHARPCRRAARQDDADLEIHFQHLAGTPLGRLPAHDLGRVS
ncbi:hypothetical protein D9M72_473680 [compost metagenome]